MTSIDKLHDSGKIRDCNLDEWLKKSSIPVETYKLVSGMFGANEKPPKLEVGNATEFLAYEKPDTITVNLEQQSNFCKSFMTMGIHIPFSIMTGITLGEEMTHYLSFQLAQENFKEEEKFANQWLERGKEGCDDFLNYASIRSQVEGIGAIGRKHTARKHGVPHYDLGVWAIMDATLKCDNRILQNAIDMFDLGLACHEDYKELEKVFGYAKNAMGAAGQMVVADRMELEYNKRFPELIRKRLEPETYRNAYVEFLRGNMPSVVNSVNKYFTKKI
jgi:hypothetical protein